MLILSYCHLRIGKYHYISKSFRLYVGLSPFLYIAWLPSVSIYFVKEKQWRRYDWHEPAFCTMHCTGSWFSRQVWQLLIIRCYFIIFPIKYILELLRDTRNPILQWQQPPITQLPRDFDDICVENPGEKVVCLSYWLAEKRHLSLSISHFPTSPSLLLFFHSQLVCLRCEAEQQYPI